jgi:hypothetical protein
LLSPWTHGTGNVRFQMVYWVRGWFQTADAMLAFLIIKRCGLNGALGGSHSKAS